MTGMRPIKCVEPKTNWRSRHHDRRVKQSRERIDARDAVCSRGLTCHRFKKNPGPMGGRHALEMVIPREKAMRAVQASPGTRQSRATEFDRPSPEGRYCLNPREG